MLAAARLPIAAFRGNHPGELTNKFLHTAKTADAAASKLLATTERVVMPMATVKAVEDKVTGDQSRQGQQGQQALRMPGLTMPTPRPFS